MLPWANGHLASVGSQGNHDEGVTDENNIVLGDVRAVMGSCK